MLSWLFPNQDIPKRSKIQTIDPSTRTDRIYGAVYSNRFETVIEHFDAIDNINGPYGLNLGRIDCVRRTLLHILLTMRNIDIFNKLRQSEVWPVNLQDTHGNTPLHYAAMMDDNVNIFDWLIKNGSDCNVQNQQGYTALDIVDGFWDIEKTKFADELDPVVYDEIFTNGLEAICACEKDISAKQVSKLLQDHPNVKQVIHKNPFLKELFGKKACLALVQAKKNREMDFSDFTEPLFIYCGSGNQDWYEIPRQYASRKRSSWADAINLAPIIPNRLSRKRYALQISQTISSLGPSSLPASQTSGNTCRWEEDCGFSVISSAAPSEPEFVMPTC